VQAGRPHVAADVLQQMPAHAGLYPRAPHLSAVLPALLDQHDARACLDLLLLACSGPRDERGANAGLFPALASLVDLCRGITPSDPSVARDLAVVLDGLAPAGLCSRAQAATLMDGLAKEGRARTDSSLSTNAPSSLSTNAPAFVPGSVYGSDFSFNADAAEFVPGMALGKSRPEALEVGAPEVDDMSPRCPLSPVRSPLKSPTRGLGGETMGENASPNVRVKLLQQLASGSQEN